MLLKNTLLSQEAFEQHFNQLIKAHERETNPVVNQDKGEDKIKRINEKMDEQKLTDDSLTQKNLHNSELEKQVLEFEEADKKVREATGADDINEICQKFSNLRETKYKLKKEKKDLDKMCDVLEKKKGDLVNELNKLKYQGQDEITRKEIEDVSQFK